MEKENDLVTIGKISRHQGNKGEVRVIPLTDDPERFQFLKSLFLKREDTVLRKEIQSLRYHKKFIILKLEGVEDIGQARELKDFYVQIPRTEMIPLKEDQYYIDDLLGDMVITSDGHNLGKVVEIVTTAGTDVFVVQGKEKEFMIPAAREIIIEIDEVSGKIIINPIPGLLEL